MAVEKKGEEKNGRGKKCPMEKITEGKNNNIKSSFSTTANIFVSDFFYPHWL